MLNPGLRVTVESVLLTRGNPEVTVSIDPGYRRPEAGKDSAHAVDSTLHGQRFKFVATDPEILDRLQPGRQFLMKFEDI